MQNPIVKAVKSIFLLPPLENLLRKFTKGKHYGTFITRIAPNHYQYKPTKRVIESDGIHFQLNMNDLMDWWIYWGFAETPRRKLYSLVKENDVVIDVGANLGDVALHFAQLVGENGKVYAFEPFPSNFAKLKKNVELNNFGNIETLEIGIGDKNQTLSMIIVDDNNAGMNRISPNASDENGQTLIKTIKLDDFVVERGINKIDLIKIDVEGFEFNVLKGASDTIKRFKPVLFVEIVDKNLKEQNTSAAKTISFIESFGYEIHRADSDATVSSDNNYEGMHFDIVAAPILND